MRGFMKSILFPGLTAGPLRYLLLLIALLTLPAGAFGFPRMESRWSANPVRPGKDFRLTISAGWKGDAGLYAIKTPVVEFSEEILSKSVSSRSFREGEENVVSYSWELVAEEKGRFEPFPVTITVFSAGEPEPVEKELATEPLTVDVARWHGIPVTTVILSAGAGLAFIGLLGWIIRKKKSRPAASEPLTQEADPARLLHNMKEELNTCRVRGDTLSFLETAHRIYVLLFPGETPASQEIACLLDQARYGNLRLSGEEMERWTRKVKRLELSGEKK